MTRTRYTALLVAVPTVLVLAACAGRASGTTATADPALPADTAARVSAAGIAPDLLYVTDVDGFELATQSVGVVGDDGMSATYVRYDDEVVGTVLLTTSRVPDPSAVPCDGLPDSSDAVQRCTVTRGAAHVALEGEGVESATLRAAAEAVRVPRTDELDALLADLPVPGPPVVRGDLPPEGDGAPLNPTGPGG